MPPRTKFTQEQIVDAAFKVASTEGLTGLTVRKVAKILGASVAPIYANFTNSDALHEAVLAKAAEIGAELAEKYRTGDPFLDIGAASLCFAHAYPRLFWDVIHQQAMPASVYDAGPGAQILAIMAADPKLGELSDNQRRRLLLKLRIFQMGITTLAAQKMLPEDMDLEQQIRLLAEAGEQLSTVGKS